MSWWSRSSGRTAAAPSSPTAEPPQDTRRNAGEYQLLHVYLRDRYADRVVLNFADIEGLLGFALPERARLQPEWWSVTRATGRGSVPSDAWTLAGRTASANVPAGIVVFDRQVAPKLRRVASPEGAGSDDDAADASPTS